MARRAVLQAALLSTSLVLSGLFYAPSAIAAEAATGTSAAAPQADVWEPAEANRTPEGEVPTTPWTPTVVSEDPGAPTPPEGAAPGDDGLLEGAPAGTPVGSPGLGLQDFYGTEAFPVTDRLTATVNLANGNLVLRAQDFAVTAPGLSLQLDRFYNGLSSGAGAFGQASVLSTGRDVGLQITSSAVTFSGPSGFTAVFTPTSGGNHTAPVGVNADLLKRADGTYLLTYRRTGERLTFSASGFLTSDTDRNGVGLSLLYKAAGEVGAGQVASITDAAGRVTTFRYDSGNRIVEIVDPGGRSFSYAYDPGGNLRQVYTSGSGTIEHTYDTSGRLVLLQIGEGRFTRFGYDTSSRVTSVARYTTIGASSGDASTNTFAYAAGSTTQTNALGKNTTYTLDSSGRVTKVTDQLGRARSTTWTANGDVASAVDAMGVGSTPGNATTYSYDSNNSVTAVTTPTGAATQLAYVNGTGCATTDAIHPYQPKCVTDAQGKRQSLTYDTPGNVTKVQDTTGGTGGVSETRTYQRPTGATSGTTCGAKPGQVCSSTDGKGAVTSYAYNANGDVTTVTPPAPLGVVRYSYDSLSRLISYTNGNGTETTYRYDAANRVTQQRPIDRTVSITTTAYDFDGNQTSISTDADGVSSTSTYTYDALSRQTVSTAPGPDSTIALATAYDKAGNVTQYTDRAGLVTYTYDAANQLTALAEPGGSCPTTGTGTACTRFGYNANGVRTTTTYPGGVVQTATVDKSGRPTRILAQKPGSPAISDLSYSYTAAGQTGTAADRSLVQTRTSTVSITAGAPSATPNGAVTTYGYDNLSRLTAVNERTGTGTAPVVASWAYGYDAVGNRTNQTIVAGGATQTQTVTYNAADQITTITGAGGTGQPGQVTYDASGNQTAYPATTGTAVTVASPARTASYTSTDQVAGHTVNGTSTTAGYLTLTGNNPRTGYGATTYQNGALGLSSQKTGTTTTAFIRDADGTLIATRTGGVSQYYLSDNLGSVIGLVDGTGTKTAGYAYDPYGTTRTVTGAGGATTTTALTTANANPYRYTGGYRDADTGLYKLGYRYYDTTQGRFTQQDPSGQETNSYLYAIGNPINAVDSSGLAADPIGAIFTLVDIAQAAQAIEARDWQTLKDIAVDYVAGYALNAVCIGLATAAGFATAGVGFGLTALCAAISGFGVLALSNL